MYLPPPRAQSARHAPHRWIISCPRLAGCLGFGGSNDNSSMLNPPHLPARASPPFFSRMAPRNFTFNACFHAHAPRAALQLIFWKRIFAEITVCFMRAGRLELSAPAPRTAPHICPAAPRQREPASSFSSSSSSNPSGFFQNVTADKRSSAKGVKMHVINSFCPSF